MGLGPKQRPTVPRIVPGAESGHIKACDVHHPPLSQRQDFLEQLVDMGREREALSHFPAGRSELSRWEGVNALTTKAALGLAAITDVCSLPDESLSNPPFSRFLFVYLFILNPVYCDIFAQEQQ